MEFEKARGFFGDDAKSFEAQLISDDKGNPCWTTKSIEETTYEKVVTMLNDGMSQKEIAIELDVNKSTVSLDDQVFKFDRTNLFYDKELC